jgi:hypothetical protein
MSSNAQQVITFFTNKKQTETIEYTLPHKVTYKTNESKRLQLILEKVNNDFFYFSSLQNSEMKYTIRYQDLKFIKFYKKGEIPLKVGQYSFIAIGTYFTAFSGFLIKRSFIVPEWAKLNKEVGFALLLPASLSFIISTSFNNSLPPKLKFVKNKYIVK